MENKSDAEWLNKLACQTKMGNWGHRVDRFTGKERDRLRAIAARLTSPSVEAAYVRLAHGEVERTEEIIESVLFVDYDSKGNAIGIEILARGIESTL